MSQQHAPSTRASQQAKLIQSTHTPPTAPSTLHTLCLFLCCAGIMWWAAEAGFSAEQARLYCCLGALHPRPSCRELSPANTHSYNVTMPSVYQATSTDLPWKSTGKGEGGGRQKHVDLREKGTSLIPQSTHPSPLDRVRKREKRAKLKRKKANNFRSPGRLPPECPFTTGDTHTPRKPSGIVEVI
jgi:hypothetical protein